MKKILSIIVIMVIVMNSLNVHAESQNYYFSYEIGENNVGHWVNLDPAMPDEGNYFFYVKNGMVYYIPEIDAIPLILNKGIGLTMKPEILANFILNYLQYRVITSPVSAVYNSSQSVGITCDDLADLPVMGTTINIPNDEEITLPSGYVNNVYNYYETWAEENNYDSPDYINVETRNRSFFLNKLNNADSRVSAYRNYLNNEPFGVQFFTYNPSTLTYNPTFCGTNGDVNEQYFVSTSDSAFDSYCDLFGLNKNDIVVTFTDLLLNSNSIRLFCSVYDETIRNTNFKYTSFNVDGTYSSGDGNNSYSLLYSTQVPCAEIQYLTVYKNHNVLNQFINGTYAPITFVNQEFMNFSTDNDNTVTTTITEMNNATNVNETIYNSTSESFTEYYTENNYHVDNSVTITNNTEIFNTYYGDASGGGDNGGGDNGGGGEIIVPDYDFGYLKVITDILAEFLQGVQNLNEMIIETIQSITLSFGGITTLFESVFGWLPDPILGLMIIGLGLALLGSFITWFR